jgi:thioredoxin-dependent peroxiredoxin
VLRDSASEFLDANCAIVGASFDTPHDNLAFARAQEFDYPLLSDVDRQVGAAYQVLRPADDQYSEYPRRYSYLIDGTGIIRRAYAVSDVAAHAADVLADLRELPT